MNVTSWYDPVKKRYGAEVGVDERDLLADKNIVGDVHRMLVQKLAAKLMERIAPVVDRVLDEVLKDD